ncbi:hypothetical protein BGZ61DRAFT_63511 [Ilyonectria robusta]|uniref:uncharacterized protein n=1 Tax=Ilyonectria robusta TaxID=1079257 RepID=UPI001E8D6B72|nr:uncharacterized protein BGZ61DRAFT_63511 [Ilyonectria robusta]KAH8683543.1 hypothetical protein BGZ61DRAFT_63511 [Ilyonectria robusta]
MHRARVVLHQEVLCARSLIDAGGPTPCGSPCINFGTSVKSSNSNKPRDQFAVNSPRIERSAVLSRHGLSTPVAPGAIAHLYVMRMLELWGWAGLRFRTLQRSAGGQRPGRRWSARGPWGCISLEIKPIRNGFWREKGLCLRVARIIRWGWGGGGQRMSGAGAWM